MTGPEAPTVGVAEIQADGLSADIYRMLAEGHVFIVRGLREIHDFRRDLIDLAEAAAANEADGPPRHAFENFYARREMLDPAGVLALTRAIRAARTGLRLSAVLAPMVARLGGTPGVRLDGGINRLVLPAPLLERVRHAPGFLPTDFARETADGEVETLMGPPANIHRDFNRPHEVFQFNLWFPLHDAGPGECLRIWPSLYRATVSNMPATPEIFSKLPAPLSYGLGFGDAIMFHGEHIHTSPQAHAGSPDYWRHTYDFRVATCCYDDNSHYRKGFVDLDLFTVARAMPEAPVLDKFVAIGRARDIAEIQELFAFFAALPHIDDPFRRIAEALVGCGPEADPVLVSVAAHLAAAPAMPGTLLRVATIAGPRLSIAARRELLEACVAACRGKTIARCWPITYPNPKTQATLAEIHQFASQQLAALAA